MNDGYSIENGFIRFGTIGHRILLFTYDNKKVSQPEFIKYGTGGNRSGVSDALSRLTKAGFLYPAKRQFGGHRSHVVFSLDPPEEPLPPPLPTNERTKRYRYKKFIRVSSIFELGQRMNREI